MTTVKRKKSRRFDLDAWQEPARARQLLTRAHVVQRALAVLEKEGYDGLTMRRLAEELKVKAASLYNHVRDKDELLALLGDAICAELADPPHTGSWRTRLESMAVSTRKVLMSHRDSAQVLAATPPIGPNRLRAIEQILKVLDEAGFSAADTADAAHVLNSYVVGLVLDETLGQPATAAATKRRWEEGRRLFKSLPKERYPTLVRLADALIDASPERRFLLGVRALLDGIELRLSKKRN